MSSQSVAVREPARPEPWLLGNELWRMYWGCAGLQVHPRLQSQLRRCRRGRISLCHSIHGCRTPLIAFGQLFLPHAQLEELQTAKAGCGICARSRASLSVPAEGLP